jgi:hypothetical protein
MEALLIPTIVLFLALAWFGIPALYVSLRPVHTRHGRKRAWRTPYNDLWAFVLGGFGLILTLTMIVCPTHRYLGHGDIEALQSYYEMVDSMVIEEGEDYVVVAGDSGIWQSGEHNIAWYNATLRQIRYWDSRPVVGTVYLTPPAELKYIRLSSE